MFVVHALGAGLVQAAAFFWDSLFGLIFGFLVSAIVQVMLTPATLERYLGPGLRGLLYGTGFGIISSACSYGAAAAARGFYRSGADARSVFAFLISSTNMNLAILILFWSLLGWRFAFAEFFGGAIIIVVVALGLTLLSRIAALRLRASTRAEFILSAVEGLSAAESASFDYAPSGRSAQDDIPSGRSAQDDIPSGRSAQDDMECEHHRHEGPVERSWSAVAATAIADVKMLRTELIVGYLIAGYAAALIPTGAFAAALRAVGAVPDVGYLLLLIAGLLIAVATFVCSMGNVPVARYLANAGIPLGANTTFIYGDLLILPLIGIYRKSFPPALVWAFLGLFTIGALLAGAIMERLIGNGVAGMSAASMTLNDRFTLISNLVGLAAVAALAVAATRGRRATAARE